MWIRRLVLTCVSVFLTALYPRPQSTSQKHIPCPRKLTFRNRKRRRSPRKENIVVRAPHPTLALFGMMEIDATLCRFPLIYPDSDCDQNACLCLHDIGTAGLQFRCYRSDSCFIFITSSCLFIPSTLSLLSWVPQPLAGCL